MISKEEEEDDDPCLSTTSTSSTTTLIHCNTATEQQATNEGGSLQNPNLYYDPSAPSLQPSIASTLRPTRNIIPFVLSGTLYYDLNANSRRENRIVALAGERHLGNDVEYSVGLGGVTVQLVECHDDGPSAADASDEEDEEEEARVVTAVTIGVNVQGRHKLITSGGDYNLVDIKVDRSYYINVKAPMGYLLTGGICNDEIGGWECDQGLMSGGRRRRRVQQQQQDSKQLELWQHNETKLGIPEGRSSKCVSVDKTGLTDSTLDIGVMRLGDVVTFVVGYNVVLDRDEDTMTTTINSGTADPMTRRNRRMQKESLDEEILPPKDFDAIRNVVTEIFATNLQKTLEQRNLSFVQIDEVLSLDVQYRALDATRIGNNDNGSDNLFFGGTERRDDATTRSIDNNNIVGTTKNIIFPNNKQNSGGINDDEDDFFTTHSLSVDLIVKGHYRKDMEVNIHDGTTATTIEKLIQNVTSGNANRDEKLLEDLLEYNSKCLEQITKMEEPGFTLDDYSEVHSSKGILKLFPSRGGAFNSNGPNVFSAACANGGILDFLMNDQEAEEVEVVTTTKIGESQGALDKESTASVEDAGSLSPWLLILIVLVCTFVGVCLVIFLVRRRRSAKEKDKHAMDGARDENDERGPLGALFGWCNKKKRIISDDTEFCDIEAGVEGGDKLGDDDKLSATDVSRRVVEEGDKEPKKYSGDEEDNSMDQLDENAVKTEMDRTEEKNKADAPSLNLDSSNSTRRRRRRTTRMKSNSDFANEAIESKQNDTTLRRSICDLDIGTKRMKGSQELSALILGETVADHDNNKKRGHENRGNRRRVTVDLQYDKDRSNDRRRRRSQEKHQATSKNSSIESSRRRGRKHDPLRRSIDDSNIGLRSRGTSSTLNDAPKGSRRKSRKPDPLRKSQDDSNLGLLTAGAAAANLGLRTTGAAAVNNNNAKKTTRRKSRKHDPLRMSQDDSNVGLRTAREKATKSDSDGRRKGGRRQDPLRRSRCDLDIGTKRQSSENILALKDRSSKIERHRHDRRTKGEREKRPSVQRSSSK